MLFWLCLSSTIVAFPKISTFLHILGTFSNTVTFYCQHVASQLMLSACCKSSYGINVAKSNLNMLHVKICCQHVASQDMHAISILQVKSSSQLVASHVMLLTCCKSSYAVLKHCSTQNLLSLTAGYNRL